MSKAIVKRLLYITSEDWFFESHFAHIARAAQQCGFEVSMASQDSQAGLQKIHGLKFYPQKFERGKRSLLHILRALPRLIATLRKAQPSIVHIIGLQNILFAAPVAALFSRARLVLTPIGLGQFWTVQGPHAGLARACIRFLLFFLRGKRFFYVFENDEDPAELYLENYSRLTIIGGAGVDEAALRPQPFLPDPPVRAAVVSRMLKTKGILECAEAVRGLRQDGYNITLDLWGAPDPANASSLTEEELNTLSTDGVIWRGLTNDIQAVWRNAHVAMLLSVREGLPKSLLEAAACGRPIIASDVPGCRALVRNGREGFLVSLGDVAAVKHALIRLAQDQGLRKKLGAAARERINQGFTQRQVAKAMLEVYAAALD